MQTFILIINVLLLLQTVAIALWAKVVCCFNPTLNKFYLILSYLILSYLSTFAWIKRSFLIWNKYSLVSINSSLWLVNNSIATQTTKPSIIKVCKYFPDDKIACNSTGKVFCTMQKFSNGIRVCCLLLYLPYMVVNHKWMKILWLLTAC